MTETEIIEKYKYYRAKILKDHHICLNKSYDTHAHIFVKIFSGKTINVDNNYNAIELNILGMYHWLILGDIENAFKFWYRSMTMGNAFAMCNIGNYYFGIRDYDNALKYYLQAVDAGYSIANYNLCMYYLTTNVDHEKAKEHFKMGKDTDSDDFFCHLVNMHYYVIVEKDFVQASNCAIKALECTNTNVCTNVCTNRDLGFVHGKIGACYTRAGTGTEYYEKAMEHLEKAIEYEEFCGLEHVVVHMLKTQTYCEKLFYIFKIVFEQNNWKELYKRMSKHCNKTIRWKMLFALGKVWDENKRDRASINSLMKELEDDCVSVSMLKNKLWKAEKYQIQDKCPICLSDNVLCVEMYCGHHVCYLCFDPKMVCYYRCKNLFCIEQGIEKDRNIYNFAGHIMMWSILMGILLTICSISFGMIFDFDHHTSQKSNDNFPNQTER